MVSSSIDSKDSLCSKVFLTPLNKAAVSVIFVHEVVFQFRKLFKNNGGFILGIVSKIRLGVENNKGRRCTYSDGDFEDLSLIQLRTLSRLYPLPENFNNSEEEEKK